MRDCHFNFLLWRHPQVCFSSLLSFVDYDKKWRPQESAIKDLTHIFALRKSWSRSGDNPEWKQLVDQSLLTGHLTTFSSHIYLLFFIDYGINSQRLKIYPAFRLIEQWFLQTWRSSGGKSIRTGSHRWEVTCFCHLRVNSDVWRPGVPAELNFVSVGQILRRLSGGCLLIQRGVFLSGSRFFFPSFLLLLIIVIKSDIDLSHGDSFSCLLFPPWGRALPLTDAEQRLTEIWEACYEGKTKKVQLSWMPQLRASHDQTAFSINKGVKTFDLCGKHSVLVTGGLDRLVRMWNPHFSGWEITMNSSGLPRSPRNVRHFLSLFLFPGNQLVFWKATVLPLATSASPQRTVRSSPFPLTTLWKWFLFFYDSFVFCFRNQSLILSAQGLRHVSKTFFSPKFPLWFPWLCFRSGIFRSSIACLRWILRKVGSVVALLRARTPLLWNPFMLPLTAWLCSPWRKGRQLRLCALFMKEPSPVFLYISEKIFLLVYFGFYMMIFIIAWQKNDIHRDLFK